MSKPARIIMCALLIVALAIPALADGHRGKRTDGGIRAKMYAGGAQAADRTAGFFTNCLHRTFSFFNPCLDLVKGCTSMVLAPVEKPFDYMEKAIESRWSGTKARKAPACK